MPQERLTMRKIKEILRLKYEAGLSNRAIAGACNISNSTVGQYLRRAKAAGVSWPLNELSEDELYQKLFGEETPYHQKRSDRCRIGKRCGKNSAIGCDITFDFD